MIRTALAVTFAGAAACAELDGSQQADVRCDPLPGWEAAADAAHGGYLILGELHGTAETPAALGELACAAAARGDRVLVAMELSNRLDPDLQRAWTSPGAAIDEALAQLFEGRQDGVGSAAMGDLVKHLRAVRDVGGAIDVVAFNAGPDEESAFSDHPGQEPHERAQAANIQAARDGHDIVLVLVGSLHARKVAFGVDGPFQLANVKPMAMHLSGGPVVSLRVVHNGGTAWNCQPKEGVVPQPGQPITDDMIECAAHPAGPTSGEGWPAPFQPGRVDLAPSDDAAYDGYVHVGAITGSPEFEAAS